MADGLWRPAGRGFATHLSVVTLRQAGAGADALGASHALVAMYNGTFLFGPGFMACVNALLLGSLLYQSGLVPRIIPLVSVIGAPLLFASDLAVLFGVWTQGSVPAGIATVPIALSGGLPRRLSGRQGLQALTDHRGNDRHQHPVDLPGRHRLTIDHPARSTRHHGSPKEGERCPSSTSTTLLTPWNGVLVG
jgi:hypothetical protein